MKRSDIARLAGETLSRYEAEKQTSCFAAEGGVGNLLELIAQMLGYEVVNDPTLESPAMGEFNAGLGRISVRPDLAPAVRAFTIAHEIGHAVCHPDQVLTDDEATIDEEVGLAEQDDGIFKGYDEASRQELEANIFAAELLVPTWKVRELVSSDPDWTVDSLTKVFGVSRSAMVSQLSATYFPGDWATEEASKDKAADPPDTKQLEAIGAPTPALILAGPGAGKTRILVDRFVRLVEQGTQPGEILALTFTNKAAGEMLDRIAARLPNGSQGLAVSTFHSFGQEVLKLYGQHLGLQAHPKLLPGAELYAFLRDRLGKLPLGSYEDLRRPTRNLKILINAVSRAKDELVGPAEYLALAQRWIVSAQSGSEDDLKKAHKAVDVANFYAAYERLLSENGAADFGDLIRFCVTLLAAEGVGDEIRSKYRHILVDETQDINYATSEMLRLLDGGRGVIWAVGDPRQSIYRFRGASSVSLLRFPEVFPGTTIVELEKNYRSNEDIVAFGQAFEFPKREAGDDLPVPKLSSGRTSEVTGSSVSLCEAPSEIAELSWIALHIKELQAKGERLENFAVLCRTRAQAQKVAEAFARNKVPNNWAGSLDKRDAFKDIVAALYLAADNTLALTRLWTGSEADLRALMRARKELKTRSLSRVLYEAADGKIEGLSEAGIVHCTELKKLAGKLGALGTPGQVVERYAFDLCSWTRDLLARAPESSISARATLGQLLGMAKSFSKANPGTRGSVKEFLRFVLTAQEAGELREQGAPSQRGLVNVATIHASKGLEWPYVIVPFFAKTKLPPPKRNPEYVPPPGLIKGEDPSDTAIELACLVYVALTRAKDSLTLTYASHYGKPTKTGSQNAGISSLLTDAMLVAPARQGLTRYVAAEVPEDAEPIRVSLGHQFEGAIPFSALKAFDECPKRFELQYALGMHDTERGYLDFRDAVTDTTEWILGETEEGRSVTEEMALAAFDEVWRAKQAEHWYEERYVESGHRLVIKQLEAIRQGVIPRKEYVEVKVGEHTVRLGVDSIEETPDGLLISKVNYGPPAKSHLDKPEQRLLTHAAVSKGSNLAPLIRYPLHGHVAETQTTARKVAITLNDIQRDIKDIITGPYTPKPQMMTCRGCFAALICPANPEDEEE